MLTRIAPILAVAYWVRVHSAQFGAQIPTRSPLVMPGAEEAEGERVDFCVQLRVAQPDPGRPVDQGKLVGVAGDGAVQVLADGVAQQRCFAGR